jgi:hypothetical protein
VDIFILMKWARTGVRDILQAFPWCLVRPGRDLLPDLGDAVADSGLGRRGNRDKPNGKVLNGGTGGLFTCIIIIAEDIGCCS